MKYALMRHAGYFCLLSTPSTVLKPVFSSLEWLLSGQVESVKTPAMAWHLISWDARYGVACLLAYILGAMWLVIPADALAMRYTRYCRESWRQ